MLYYYSLLQFQVDRNISWLKKAVIHCSFSELRFFFSGSAVIMEQFSAVRGDRWIKNYTGVLKATVEISCLYIYLTGIWLLRFGAIHRIWRRLQCKLTDYQVSVLVFCVVVSCFWTCQRSAYQNFDVKQLAFCAKLSALEIDEKTFDSIEFAQLHKVILSVFHQTHQLLINFNHRISKNGPTDII